MSSLWWLTDLGIGHLRTKLAGVANAPTVGLKPCQYFIRALCVNHQGFESHLLESADRGIAYRVIVGKDDVEAERLHDPSGRQQIKIVPVIAGAGGKFGQVILGAALLGIAWWNPAGIMATTLFSAGGTTVTLASLSVNVGLGLVLGGVAQMLSPQPRADSPAERPENQPSYAFNGAVNTTAQGQPVPIGYRRGAAWLMNTNTLSVIAKMKDGQGNYLWRPAMADGNPSTLLGYPVYEDENMPDIDTNALPIAFGNFQRGYTIVDRTGTSILRDPLTKKGYVGFYSRKRVSGAVVNSEAIKLLKVAAS